MQRRRFIQSILAAAGAAGGSAACAGLDGLKPDAGRLLDLPDGFSYDIVSKAGTTMSDGLLVPGDHDGMAAFPAANGRVLLVCNHELHYRQGRAGAFTGVERPLDQEILDAAWDAGGGEPLPGGTTTTLYDPVAGRTLRQWMSLAGTDNNCAGGPTPWGSWLSCEECFRGPGTTIENGREFRWEERHGYVFEVPSTSTGLTRARPIKAMGRFEHEAVAVHAATGIVYLTEDRHHSLFYRYLPDSPGNLHAGGRLQALAIRGASSQPTHNWGNQTDIPQRNPLDVEWVDLNNVDPSQNNLRLRGAAAGAATFARGEGLCIDGDSLYFTCTIGGPARFGQIFHYRVSPDEGQAGETTSPGTIELLVEANTDSILRHADNLTMSPWGDLIVCEDTVNHCGLVGVKPDGELYALADNAYSNSELTGICFSPDGQTMFVNIQEPGTTLAIRGPFDIFH